MKSLPSVARWYLYTLWAGATLLLIATLASYPYSLALILTLLLWIPLYVVADYYEFQLDVGHGNSVSMTVADAPAFFLAAVAGVQGTIAIVLGSLLVDLLRRRPWYKTLFNGALRCFTFLTLVSIHDTLVPRDLHPFAGSAGLLAYVLMAGAYYVVNTLLVATILAFSTRRPPLQVYQDSFATVHWVHFATTPFGALAAAMWPTNPWLLPLCVLPLMLLQRWFKTSADLQSESRRNEALAREQAELAAERERLLGELRTKQAELVRSSKLAALGTFAAGIGHEFNNLLAGMLGFAQLGLASQDVREKDEALEVAVRLAMRGRSITGGLLTFARRRETQHVPYLLDLVVEETLALVERELAKENIALVRRITPVPETMCDPGQIQQVVLNLVNNARDAMRAQGGGTLTVALAEHNRQLELVVSDTGHGIPAELLDSIFQPFVSTKGALNGSATPGTGLGLAISHGIIEGHGGSIEVRSPSGEGATMIVRLPVVAATLAEPAPALPGPPLRVLIVDDEPDVGRSLARLLEGHGHDVVVAQNAEAALRAFEARSYDVVLTDVVMPGMGGVALVRSLRALNPAAAVIAMSGQGGDLSEQQLAEAGVQALLRKPFALDELLREFERVSSPALRH
jgi:signal transduction histidine kinase